MYLRFEDWSNFLFVLDKKGYPHGDRIIKVYTSQEDPRGLYDKPDLVVFKSEGHPFSDEVFDMGDRGQFSGKDIEAQLATKGVTDKGKEIVRALLRFSTTEETQFTQAG